jgi:hypothetical protein
MTKYVGETNKKGERHGKGTVYNGRTALCTGNFRNNLLHGWGEYFYNDDVSYCGEFKNDLCHGYGMIVWSTGGHYQGEWKDDKRCGYGIYVRSDGCTYRGMWENNLQHGPGEKITPAQTLCTEQQVMKRKRIFKEVWDKGTLIYHKEVLFYPNYAYAWRRKAFVDVIITFS